MTNQEVFADIVERVGSCIRRARQLQALSESEIAQIDEQIEVAFTLIEDELASELNDFLDEQGVTEKLRKISLSVVQALNDIDGYNVQPEEGSITIIKNSMAISQPLTPLASAASLYFHIDHSHPHFDFILACLSRQEFFEIIQLHHYFRNLPSQTTYRQDMLAKIHEDFDRDDGDWDDEAKKKAS